jgi:hypothetical protein
LVSDGTPRPVAARHLGRAAGCAHAKRCGLVLMAGSAKGSATNAIKRALAAFGPGGGDVYRLEFGDENIGGSGDYQAPQPNRSRDASAGPRVASAAGRPLGYRPIRCRLWLALFALRRPYDSPASLQHLSVPADPPGPGSFRLGPAPGSAEHRALQGRIDRERAEHKRVVIR